MRLGNYAINLLSKLKDSYRRNKPIHSMIIVNINMSRSSVRKDQGGELEKKRHWA